MCTHYIEGISGRQTMVLPPGIDELIAESNPVRFVDAFVDGLDLEALRFTRVRPPVTGRPGYNPRMMLKLYIYGYMNRIRATRRLEEECGRNIELWWLLEGLQPDHNSISDFRQENAKALNRVFTVFVRLCRELKLIGHEFGIDGSTYKAVNGLDHATSEELTRKKLAHCWEEAAAIEAYLKGMDDVNQGRLDKPLALDIDPEELPDRAQLKKRIQKHTEDLMEIARQGESHLLTTDPEARVMPAKRGAGLQACYNVETAVEDKSHLIVGFRVTNAANDMGQLKATADEVKAVLEQDTLHAIADKGFESGPDILDCLMNGIIPDVGFKYDRKERAFSIEHIPTFISIQDRASAKAEDIQRCLHAGVLPDCYAHTNIRVEVQYRDQMSCFIRHEDGRVTCPMGKEMYAVREKKYGVAYRSKEACRTCPNRCTGSHNPKEVQFGKDTDYVPVRMYSWEGLVLQPLPHTVPHTVPHTPYNSLDRKDHPQSRVMIFIRRDKKRQKKRMTISEHPFGTIKHYDNARYFLCRGKEKVTAEIALSYLAYDIRRVIKLLGVPRLIEAVGILMPKLQETDKNTCVYMLFLAQISRYIAKYARMQ